MQRACTPAGVPAISRAVERSDTPGLESRLELHPGGGPARTAIGMIADSPVDNRQSRGVSLASMLRPLQGRNMTFRSSSGGVAALSPRLMAVTPQGSIVRSAHPFAR